MPSGIFIKVFIITKGNKKLVNNTRLKYSFDVAHIGQNIKTKNIT